MTLEDAVRIVLAKLHFRMWSKCNEMSKEIRYAGDRSVEARDFASEFTLAVCIFIKKNPTAGLELCWLAGFGALTKMRRKLLCGKRRLIPEVKLNLKINAQDQWSTVDPEEAYIYKEQTLCDHSWHKRAEKDYICRRCGRESTYKIY